MVTGNATASAIEATFFMRLAGLRPGAVTSMVRPILVRVG
jgi:hypothetical protein